MWNPFRRRPVAPQPEPTPDFTSEAARRYHESNAVGR